MLRFLSAVLFTFLSIATAQAAPQVGKPAPDFTAGDQNGKEVKLSDYKGRIVVLEWHNPECPFVKKHYGSGNMQKLQAYAHAQKAAWIIVNSGAPGKQGAMTSAEAKAFVGEHKLSMDHYIADPEGKIGKLYDAKTTPHMFVVDKEGNVAYMGAIDDRPSADPKDIDVAVNYVRAAIEGLNGGTPLAVTSTQSYGCSVKY